MLLFLNIRKFMVCRREACINGNVVVWYSTQGRGWGSKRRRCLPAAALYSNRINGKENENGAWEAIGNNFLHDGSWMGEPRCIAEVCPPGTHVLERRVQEVPCRTRRRKNNWAEEHTYCDEQRTHRCKLCPYWCCTNRACHGEAWDDSVGLVHAWNNEAGLTGSQTLYCCPPEGILWAMVPSTTIWGGRGA